MTSSGISRGNWLKLLLGIGVSGALIWWTFRDTPFADIWVQIRTMRVAPMVAAVVVATLPFYLRVPRWAILLRHEDGSEIRRSSLWHAVAIGFAANNVLPFRLGEVIRMGAITRLAPVPFPSALASVAVERVIDALVALSLFAIGLLVTNLTDAAGTADKARVVGIVALAALTGAVIVARWPTLATTPIARIVPAGKFRDALLNVVVRVVTGLSALGDPRRALPVLGWSVVIWLVNASSFWIAFFAFGIEVPFTGALILQGVLLIGIAVPSTPGYAGPFEAAIKATLLVLFGVPDEVALAYAVAYHIMTFVPITLLGVYYLNSTGLSLKRARDAAA